MQDRRNRPALGLKSFLLNNKKGAEAP